MNHLKALIAAIAICALIGPATAASATELDNVSGMVTPESSVFAESEGGVTFHTFFKSAQCQQSTLSGKAANTGSSSETVTLQVTSIVSTGCEATVHLLTSGSLEVHTVGTTTSNNGTVTSTGLEITVEAFGAHCIYRTSSTHFGTLTGSANTGGAATLDVVALLPRSGGRSGAFCGSSNQLTGSYKFTEPTTLNVT